MLKVMALISFLIDRQRLMLSRSKDSLVADVEEIIKMLEGWGYTHEESMELAKLTLKPITIADDVTLDETTENLMSKIIDFGG